MQKQGGKVGENKRRALFNRAECNKLREQTKINQGTKSQSSNKTVKQRANKKSKFTSNIEKTEIKIPKHTAEEQETC